MSGKNVEKAAIIIRLVSKTNSDLYMVKEYEQIDTVSINPTIRKWWLFALLILAAGLLGGLALLLALALGLANPRIEGAYQQNYADPRTWPLTTLNPDLQRYHAPLNLSASPLTLQASASNQGAPDSAWGFWLKTDNSELFILVNNEGYVSVSNEALPDWIGFLHIRPNRTNQLTLSIAVDGAAQLRVNDEIAWEADLTLSAESRWGVLMYRQPQLEWDAIGIVVD